MLQTVFLLSGSVAIALVLWLFLREKRIIPTVSFGAGLLLLAIASILACFTANGESNETVLKWNRIGHVVVAFVPGVWLTFAVTYSRGDYKLFLRRWWFAIGALLVLLPGAALAGYSKLVVLAPNGLRLGIPGQIVHVGLVVGATAVLVNIERTFRASVGVMRWQLKFVAVGIAALFLTRIYTSTQSLLFSTVDPGWDAFNAVALSVCCVLVFLSATRSKSFMLDLYPSTTLLHRSLTVVVVGAYLLTVGFLARAVSRIGGATALPLQALLLLAAFVVLGILLLSDRVRLQTKQFVSRHLRRPAYDVRKLWRGFSENLARQVTEIELCRASVKWISETFEVLSVTVWLVPPGEGSVLFGASTSLTDGGAAALVQEQGLREALHHLSQSPQPLDLDARKETWMDPLRALHPAHFAHGGHRICVPVPAGKQLVALLMLGDRVAGMAFSLEELELIKCVADQIGGDLVRLRLSQKLVEAREVQAFQTMATFFVHDLKNTVWSLSLLVENLRAHFNRPEFREEAVKALSTNVARMNDLIARMSSLREHLRLNRVRADFNQVISGVLEEFGGVTGVRISRDLQSVTEAWMDVEQFQKVVRNLVLNAKEASKQDGEIQVRTEQQDGFAVLTVRDDGCGMTKEFLRERLFRPFQTTKNKGIGIGMFQSKIIIEAHQGRISVDSKEGAGTMVRIALPLTGEEI